MDESHGSNGEKTQKGSIVLPIILIILGVLLLLNNFGLLDWNVWTMVSRFWPVILIVLGFELILGRGTISKSIIFIIIIMIIFSLISYHPIAKRDVIHRKIERPLHNITSAKIEINMGVGTLQLDSLSDPKMLITGTADTTTGEQLDEEFLITGDEARFTLSARQQNFLPYMNVFGSNTKLPKKWNLLLNPSIPLDLNIQTGVGKADINLEHIIAPTINIKTGVGKTELILPASGHSNVVLSGGVGESIIYIPKNSSARIHTQTGVGSVQVNGDYIRNNDEYISPDFAASENRIELNIKSGVGNIYISSL